MGEDAAMLLAIQQLHERIQKNHDEFRQEVAAVYINLARSDEVQSIKASIKELCAKLSTMPTKADCEACHRNFVDKRVFLGAVGGLGFLGTVATFWDRVQKWF